jgi:SSS family solute:Na+ symporter
MTFFQGPLLALLLLGMLTRRTTQWGGLAGMIIGVGTAVAMHSARFVLGQEHKIPYLWVAWWSFVAAIVGTILVSLVTRPYDKERLRGLVCWIPAQQEPTE